MPQLLPADVRAIDRFRSQRACLAGAKPIPTLVILEVFLEALWSNRPLREFKAGRKPSNVTVFNHTADWAAVGCLQKAWKKYVAHLSRAERGAWKARLDQIVARNDGRANLYWFYDLYEALVGQRPQRSSRGTPRWRARSHQTRDG